MVSDTPNVAEIAARLSTAGEHWQHSIDLGHGIVTKGVQTKEVLDVEIENLFLPDLAGRTVLDIGAGDGAFSFEAERRGARRVVALGHHDPEMEASHPTSSPGKERFDLARWALSSVVESPNADFMTVDIAELGAFDLTLFIGALHRLTSPIVGLRQLASLTRDLAIIETELVHVAGYAGQPLWHYVKGDSLGGDPSTHWLPSRTGLREALLDVGFSTVDFLEPIGGSPVLSPAGKVINSLSGWAKRTARSLRPSAPANFRQVIHARK